MLITNHNRNDAAMGNNGGANKTRRKTPYALIYLMAFSAVATYFYDMELGRSNLKREKTPLKFEEFQPTKAQYTRARKLGISEKRVS